MHAMPADALTCGSDVRPHRGEAGRDHDAEVLPFRPRAPHPATRRPGAPRSAAPHPDASAVPIRLTRRGRLVVAALAALLVTVISLLAASAAQATNHALSPGAARQNLVQVTVGPGQSLWSVAESTDPDQDTRAVIQRIVDLNGLSSDLVVAGQRLWVPRG